MAVLGKALFIIASVSTVVGAVDPPVAANVTNMTFSFNGTDLMGSYSLPIGDGPFPAVVIIPDHTLVTGDYEDIRATMIAQSWGMVGITADIFGDDESILSTETLAGRMDAALGAVSAMENVDSSMIAAFSYGTPTALMYALNGLGTDTLKAIVSFHADLSTNFLPEELQAVGPKLLVLSGGADDTPAEIMGLEVTLDTANATWEITRYSDAGPSFTVFENDNYNQLADMRSWQSSFEFIKEAFGITTFESAEPDGFDSVTAVDYNDTDGTALRGWLAMPNSTGPSPAVVILPDWDGVNEYEKERAVALAELGYLAFAADIYGADKQFVESTEDRVAEVGFYSTNPDIYFSRIQTAIEQVKMMNDGVLSEDIALIGYCFGGSVRQNLLSIEEKNHDIGVVLYSIRGGADAKVSVAFHGSFNVFNVTAATVSPYLLV
eukprot:scaffold23476_cov125-Cylindrotheca_fusiformis.AAC.12